MKIVILLFFIGWNLFCGAADTLYLGLRLTLPMGLQARVNVLSAALFFRQGLQRDN